MIREEMSFEEFQDSHLGYLNRTILAILNLCVTVISPIKFQLNLTYSLDIGWQPSWISERNNFSNSESPCHCDASHQVLAQSDLRFGRRCRLKNFRPSWISKRNNFSNSEPLCHCDFSHQVSAQSDLRFGRGCRLKNFKMAILDIGTE